MGRSNLEGETAQFAGVLQSLLNRTIADDARVIQGTAWNTKLGSIGVVGTRLDSLLETKPVALRAVTKEHQLWLRIDMQLYMDKDGYLTVLKSMYGISAGEDEEVIFHYDYERDKDAYTEAHLQILAKHDQLDPMILAVCTNRKKKHMGELHFPVGGRRYRPALEDVVEFLVDEMLVDPKPGWKKELEQSRDIFRQIQTKAAVRQHPEAAAAVLRSLNYTVEAPSLLKRIIPGRKGKRRDFDDAPTQKPKTKKKG